MPELYNNLGFRSHPFSKYSAEEETDYLTEIYIRPRYFDSLINDIKSGSSRFVLGERGSAKSALVYELNKKLSDENILSVIVDNYDGIPLSKNDKHLLYLIIRETLKSFIAALFKNKQLLAQLESNEKEKLALIVRDFFTSISKREFEDTYNRITKYKVKNWFKRQWNDLINKPINWAISVSLEIGSDFVSNSLGLPKVKSENFYKNYLPDVALEDLSPRNKEEVLLGSYSLLKDVLLELTAIIKKSGYNSLAIFLDKIDEFKLLEGKINNIVSFTEEILKDTNLLYFRDIALVFSIWTEVKIELNAKGVRFDKFKPLDINWTNDDIQSILQKRLDYFSKDKNFNINSLIPAKNDLGSLIELSYKSPRDLIRLFSTVYDEQAIENSEAKVLSANAIQMGKRNFCKSYDYYSIFPSKRGTKEDIISIVNRLLRVGRTRFRTTDVIAEFKFSQQSAITYIKIYKEYGRIKEIEFSGGTKEYEIIDPKVLYLISENIRSLN